MILSHIPSHWLRCALTIFCLLGTAAAQAASPQPAVPQDEKDYMAIIEAAREEYSAAKSIDGRKNARMSLQIAIHRFMGLTHSAHNWVGVYKGGKRLDSGDRSVQIEIAPSVSIVTWDNRFFDVQTGTLIKPYSAIGHVLDDLAIGDTVVFSADMIGAVVTNDDDMIRRPQIVGRFSAIKKTE
jgi:hypothetical protein